MRRKIKRRDVEWQRASCLGLDTELFYEHRTGLLEQGLTVHHLRRICVSCPIQRDCLQIAVAHEPYGFWGGMSEDERKHIHAGRNGSPTLQAMKRDFKILGLNYETVVAFVRSIERDFTYANESKFF
jgi:WhiB family redox-sensing transcriptional regulator